MKAYAIKHPDGKILRRSIRFKSMSTETPKPLSGEALKALHKAIKESEKKSTELKDRK